MLASEGAAGGLLFGCAVVKRDSLVKTKGARPQPKGDHPVGKRDAVSHRTYGALTVLEAKASRLPSLPRGYRRGVRKAWRDYWASPVSSAVDRNSDMTALLDWARARNDLEEQRELLDQEGLVIDGIKGLIPNPRIAYVKHLTATISRAELEFGMTPLARSRLGVTIGQAKLTAQELNKRLASVPEVTATEPWAEGWEEA